MRILILACSVFVAFLASGATPSPFSGTFKGKDGVIRLNETGGGKFKGEIFSDGHSLSFVAEEKAGSLTGTLPLEDEKLEFRMTLKGSILTVTMEDESSTYTKQDAPPLERNSLPTTPTVPGPAASPPAGVKTQVLRVNGVVIDEKSLLKLEEASRLKIPRGDFWYDKISGAWGVAGGPTLGFTVAGVNLGGPLQANASRGNTGVFINKRELPVQDVLGLQQLNVPVQLGRWWVDSRGDFGVEGNPAVLGNIFQFSQPRGGAYQRATAGGYIGGDGQTSYFFDPKSGSSVMVGN